MKDEDSEFDALLSGAGDKSTKKSAKKEVKTYFFNKELIKSDEQTNTALINIRERGDFGLLITPVPKVYPLFKEGHVLTFNWLVHEVMCPNVSTTHFNFLNGLYFVSLLGMWIISRSLSYPFTSLNKHRVTLATLSSFNTIETTYYSTQYTERKNLCCKIVGFPAGFYLIFLLFNIRGKLSIIQCDK